MRALGCPTEHLNGLEIIIEEKESNKSYVEAGQKVSYQCKAGPSSLVYPTPSRICLPNGTYTGVRPIYAVHNLSGRLTLPNIPRESNSLRNHLVFIFADKKEMTTVPYFVDNCTEAAALCNKALNKWPEVGKLQGNCRTSTTLAGSKNVTQTFLYLFTFHRHIHFSFANFTLFDSSNGQQLSKSSSPLLR